MRASVSLTSFFSSLRCPTVPSQLLIPMIQIISPPESPPPRISTGSGVIRRWRGALGTLGDLTLQLPSQGLTSGARLALARQGCATGSFRLNCSESLYVKDSQGLAMFERIELEEELEKARLGLRERPPMLASASVSTSLDSSISISSDSGGPTTEVIDAAMTSSDTGGSDEQQVVADQQSTGGRKTRRPSMRTQKRNMLAMQNMRFDSGGLSSCATFTAGLCHLEDYVRASETSTTSDPPSTSTEFPTVHSEQEISELSAAGDNLPNLSWLDSLRRKSFLSGNKPPSIVIRKRRSAGELVKSLSCMDLDSIFSESELILNPTASSSSSDDSNLLMEGLLKKTGCQLEDDDVEEMPTPTPTIDSLGPLRREGSWTRLRRRLSRGLSMKHSGGSSELQNSDDDDDSASYEEGLVDVLQSGTRMKFVRPLMHGLS